MNVCKDAAPSTRFDEERKLLLKERKAAFLYRERPFFRAGGWSGEWKQSHIFSFAQYL
jgi:hypothetical protein